MKNLKKQITFINDKINDIFGKGQITIIHVLILILGFGLFISYLVLKFNNPKLLVGGDNPQQNLNYKIQVTSSAHESSSDYKYIFGDKDNCFQNYPLGAPDLNYDIKEKSALFCYDKYATQYNVLTKTPVWESHVLRSSDFAKGNYVERSNNFREDENIAGKPFSAKPSDYTRTGFDRGHLAPAGDFAYNDKYMSDSFYMTNIAPQAPQNNRQIWSSLEQSIRKLLRTRGVNELYITTGVLYYKNEKDESSDGTLGQFKGIQIPTHFYKIIIEPRSGQSAAYLIPNTNDVGNHSFSEYLIQISELEKITNIDFHPLLNSEQREQIEKNSGSLNQYLISAQTSRNGGR